MSKHKARYLLPLLAVMISTACISADKPSGKDARNAVKRQENLCPEPVDQMDDDCLDITLLRLKGKMNAKYESLFRRAAAKDKKLHGLSKQYFSSVRSKWEAYREELCSDPTVETDLKSPADRDFYMCSIEQAQYHLKALERF